MMGAVDFVLVQEGNGFVPLGSAQGQSRSVDTISFLSLRTNEKQPRL